MLGRVVLLLLLLSYSLLAMPVSAVETGEEPPAAVETTEEATTETSEEGPGGVGLLMLLIGLVSVLAVGMVTISRDNTEAEATT